MNEDFRTIRSVKGSSVCVFVCLFVWVSDTMSKDSKRETTIVTAGMVEGGNCPEPTFNAITTFTNQIKSSNRTNNNDRTNKAN